MLSHHKKAKLQTHSTSLRTPVKIIAVLLFEAMTILSLENIAKAWETE